MGTAAPVRDFGTLVNRKTLPRTNAIVVAIAGVAFATLALSVGSLDATAIGVLLLALGLLGLCAWSISYKATIYENGATVESLLGSRALPFRDLRTFAYSRILMRGQPRDTIVFIPRNGKPLRIVTQPDFRTSGDADLARLVDQLTPRLTERMEKELGRSKRVRWVERSSRSIPDTPAVTVTREAFIVENGKGSVTVPFAEIDTTVLSGTFLVVQLGTKMTLFSIPCSAPNFYPGFALQQRLRVAAPPA